MAGEQILIVEDDGIIADRIQSILTKLRYDILGLVISGEEALEKVDESPCDLVLMDIYLDGELNGIETATQIRSRFDIPVVYLTAYSDDELLQQAKITEPYGYLVKPIAERELHAAIEMAFYKHKMEKKLKESEQYYRSLISNLHEDILVVDQHYRITDVNNNYLVTTGHKREEVIGRYCYQVSHGYNEPCDRHGEECFFSEVSATGKARNYCHEHMRVDGSKVWVDILLSPLRDENGNITHVIEAIRDVTEQKQAEALLRQSEKRYRDLFENANEGIAVAQDGMLKFVNPKLLDITGYSKEEITSNPFTKFIHQEDQEVVLQRHLKRLKGQQVPDVYPFRLIDKEGNIKWVELNAVLFTWEGSPATLNFLNDITARKMSEETLKETNLRLEKTLDELKETQQQLIQQERLRALGQMASGVAHDFNNALTPVMGYCQLIFMNPQTLDDKEKMTSYLKMMDTTAKDASNVVNRLRQFYRERDDEEKFAPVNLNQLVRQTIELTVTKWKDQAQSNGITISVPSELQKIPLINGNSSELRNALTNLVFNAVDAIEESGTITIRTYPKGKYVVLEVSDTGIGMTDEVKQRCFEPFFSTKEESGTGLGMSIVHGIIRRHEGKIEIDSEPGEGTTVIIYLPIQVEEEVEDEEQKTEATTRSLHVLIVEDKQEVRDVITEYLLVDGHTVETANNGREGLETFYKGRFDLVITDRAMPDMNGVQLANSIKQIAPDKPIIMLTGFGDMMRVSGDIPDAIDYLLNKPVTLSNFREALAKVIV